MDKNDKKDTPPNTISRDDLKAMISETVKAEVDGIGKNLNEAVLAAMKDQFGAATKAGFNPNPAAEIKDGALEKETENLKGKFRSFGEMLYRVYCARNLGEGDNRLRFLDAQGQIFGDIDPVALRSMNKPIPPEDQAKKTAMAGSTDSTGGFLIPPEFQAQLLALEQEESIVRQNGAWVIPMASDTLLIPRVDETTRASTLFGGAFARWTAEAASMNESEPKFAQTRLQAKELTGYSICSNTLLQDNAVALEAFLRRILSEVPAWFEDLAFLTGTGGGQPLGIQSAGSYQALTRLGTSKLYTGDITGIYSRIFPKSTKKAIWVANQTVLPALLALSTYDGSAGAATNLVWLRQYQDGIAGAPPVTILGRPVVFTEKVPALYSAGDIMFADLSYYIIGDRAALTIDASSHIGFTTNQTYWRFVKRVDGQPWLQTTLTPRNGSALSPFVGLGATS